MFQINLMTILNFESLSNQFQISYVQTEDFKPPSDKIESSFSSFKDYQIIGHPQLLNISKEDKYNVQKKKQLEYGEDIIYKYPQVINITDLCLYTEPNLQTYLDFVDKIIAQGLSGLK